MRLLVADDDLRIAGMLERVLVQQHYLVDLAHDGAAALELAKTVDYDVIILDVMMPSKSGSEVCRALRADGFTTPILMLTALGTNSDVVNGLDDGADDYLVKPFDLEILLARVRSLARRSSELRSSIIRVADLSVDLSRRTATRGDRTLRLSSKEFALLEYLAMNRGRVLSRSDIAEHVWDLHFDPNSNVVDSLVRFLRQKVDKGSELSLIHTIRGAGYYLDDTDS